VANALRFAALQNRDFRLFWFGQLISLSGTWMQSVAQGWLVYSLTKSPFYLGLVAASGTLPILLFTLAGGIVADRFRKRNLLILTQALSIVPALALGILTNIHVIAVWQVALFAAVLGTVNAFDVPARQSFIVEMVGRTHLTNAIALNSAAFHGARMVGPVIAGIAIASVGLSACFYLNALSFVAVIIALSKVRARGEIHEKSNGMVNDLLDGLRYIRGQSAIFQIIILIAIFSLLGMPFMTLLPVFAAEVFHKGPEGFGIMVGATGAGALLAALFIAWRDDIVEKTRFMAVSALCFSLLLLVFSFIHHFSIGIAILVCIGWSLVSFFAVANSYIQLSVPDNLRGRAMSVYAFVFLGTAPIGNSIIGAAANAAGTALTVGVIAVVCLITSMVFCRKICKSR
jgi:MFS family permease